MKKLLSRYFKTLILLTSCVLFTINMLTAQYLIRGTEKIAYKNDSVILFLENTRGDLQWQVSKDKILWYNIAGKSGDTLFILVDSTAYYRAEIVEGTCEPIFSDTVLVAELLDERDNKAYNICKLGTQWWMAENLKYKTNSGWWYYDNDSVTFGVFGKLYNWETAIEACPSGWHLPGDDEWQALERSLGMSREEAQKIEWRGTGEGAKLKLTGYQNFNSLFGGYKEVDESFLQIFRVATYWTQTTRNADSAWYRGIEDTSKIHRHYYDKRMAFSVRCVKNQPPELVTNEPKIIKTKEALLIATLNHSGGSAITEKGFCWSTDNNPSINDNHIEVTEQFNAQNEFSLLLENLTVGTTYYLKSYAKSDYGIGYGNEISFKTLQFSPPVVNTSTITNIGASSARSGGEILYDGEREITGKGVCWSRNGLPTIDSSHIISGTGIDPYISQMSGLKPNTTYNVRAFAINNIGISYGEMMSFSTLPVNPLDSITDVRDGKIYKTIHIGNQWWLAENLNFQSGNSWCYENNNSNCSDYGRLYSWTAAKSVCPSGWHLPGDEEWKKLEITLGMTQADADAIDNRGTNEGTQLKLNGISGFDVLFGGFRNEDGTYTHIGAGGTFWTSDEFNTSLAWYRGFASEPTIHRYYYDKDMAFSVRCVRDELPDVITSKVDSIGKTYARCSGELISNGGLVITGQGFCWGTSPNPDISGNHTTETTIKEKFSTTLTGLTTNTTYYVRAYATNSFGTAYGEQFSFLTVTLPKVTTGSITSVTSNSAISGGNLTDNGGLPVPAMGVCWSTSPEPTIYNTKTIQPGALGVYSSNITSLEPNKTYYVKAYATNSVGTAYGNQIIFQTPPLYSTGTVTDSRDSKVYTTIKIGDQKWTAENINFQTTNSWCYENNNANCVTYGRLYSWSAAKTACPSHWHLPSDAEWKTLEINLGMSLEEADNTGLRGTNQGTQLKEGGSSGFDVLFAGFRNEDGSYTHLTAGGTFWSSSEYNITNAWYRGFAGDPLIHRYYYDKDLGFSVRCLKDTLPVIITSAVSAFTDSSVVCGGNITYDGGVAVIARGICIGTSANPTIFNDTTNNGAGSGLFSSYKKGLNPNTQYHVRAYATNSEGTSYGLSVPFKTAIAKPKVTTTLVNAGSVTDSTAVSGGNVISNGGEILTARGVCWDTLPNPTVLLGTKTNDGTVTGTFSSNLTNLLPNKKYYYRAYATNSAGTGYGAESNFTTLVGYPKVTTSAVTSITETSATVSGNVTSDGGSAVTERGVCWATGVDPRLSDFKSPAGTGTGTYSANLSGLARYTKYYARAYAVNSADTAYGDTISFTTLAELPTLTTSAISELTDSSAQSGGLITNDGGAPILSKGVCWNTTGNPSITDDTTMNGTGTASFESIISSLNSSATYYVRAYALNIAGYNYGNEIVFKTLYKTDSLTDTRDNQKYLTVKIGDKWWMAQNLNYCDTGSVYYGDSATYTAIYGRLYTWTSAMKGSPSSILNPSGVQGVCPSGWHLPANPEWNNLISELGDTTSAGSFLKEKGTINWSAPNTDATNESGFSARPGGIINGSLAPTEKGTAAYFWSSTETNGTIAISKKLVNTDGGVTENTLQKSNHLSVRCIKN